MMSPGLTSAPGLATLPLSVTRPPEQASFATVRRLIMRDTFKYLSRRIISSVFRVFEKKARKIAPAGFYTMSDTKMNQKIVLRTITD